MLLNEAVGTTGIGVKKVNGLFKFYDGKIVGSTNAKPETTTEVEIILKQQHILILKRDMNIVS